jgi:hypothetical protein
MSYPNSAANQQQPTNGRQSWSAPQGGDPLAAYTGPSGFLPGQNPRRGGPGEGPAYGRAKIQADQNYSRQPAAIADPMEHLRDRRNSHGQAANGGYSPSLYDGPKQGKRGIF